MSQPIPDPYLYVAGLWTADKLSVILRGGPEFIKYEDGAIRVQDLLNQLAELRYQVAWIHSDNNFENVGILLVKE